MRARAFLPVFLFAVGLPVLGCIPDELPKKSPTRSAGDKRKKEEAVKAKEEGLAGKEKKQDAIKVDVSYLEKTWGIKCKSYSIADLKDYRTENCKQVTFLLEFTKDVDNLKELGEAFTAINNVPMAPLLFYFFDEGNLSLGKITLAKIAGEVTGKKGDTLRVSTHLISETLFKKIRKIEAHPGEKEKAKDKEKKKDAIKVDLSYLEKTWGIKCKSYKITPPEPNFLDFPAGEDKSGNVQKARRVQGAGSPAKVTFLLEFTKDVENLKELRDFLARGPSPLLWFHFFDEDNVSLGRMCLVTDIEGGVSGKKGDAIRMTLSIQETLFKKTRKIEVRPREKEKDKDKPKK